MSYSLFDYIDAHGANTVAAWVSNLQKKELAKLNEKLDKLYLHGAALRPQILSDSSVRSVLKLRVHGGVQLRPLLCRGPINMDAEFTLLVGATEVGGKLRPKGVEMDAKERRDQVIQNPNSRRKPNAKYP